MTNNFDIGSEREIFSWHFSEEYARGAVSQFYRNKISNGAVGDFDHVPSGITRIGKFHRFFPFLSLV
jgi:hypothetical protein